MLLRWRRWRRSRPFWGGLVTVAAGAEISSIPLAPLKVMVLQGVTGIVSVLIGLVLIVLGLSAWFAPHYRGLAGVLAVMVAATALVLSNLGGFFLGTILGVIGGGLIFGWQPLPTPPGPAAEPKTATEPETTTERESAVDPETARAAEPEAATEPDTGPRSTPLP